MWCNRSGVRLLTLVRFPRHFACQDYHKGTKETQRGETAEHHTFDAIFEHWHVEVQQEARPNSTELQVVSGVVPRELLRLRQSL